MSRGMFNGDRHARLLERLIRKHEASYRSHVATLIAERERDLQFARREFYDRRLEDGTWLLPQVARSRQQLHRLRERAARVHKEEEQGNCGRRREDEQRAGHEAEVGTLRRALEETRTLLAASEASRAQMDTANSEHAERVKGVEADARRLYREIADVHNSLTWRITAPIRTAFGWLRRSGNRQ
jgi:hypothetical protein